MISGTEKVAGVARLVVSVARKIVGVTAPAISAALPVVFFTPPAVFRTRKVISTTRKIVFRALEIIFSTLEIISRVRKMQWSDVEMAVFQRFSGRCAFLAIFCACPVDGQTLGCPGAPTPSPALRVHSSPGNSPATNLWFSLSDVTSGEVT
jgi:hypothetical protein